MRLSRQTLGPKFSEGARQLWLFLARHRWTQADAAREMGLPSGQLSKILYGERKPGREWATKFQERAKIKPALWDQEPLELFAPPAAPKAARAA